MGRGGRETVTFIWWKRGKPFEWELSGLVVRFQALHRRVEPSTGFASIVDASARRKRLQTIRRVRGGSES